VANLEFIQFHPTALYPAEEHAFLISEAVRGEGAVLRNHDGAAFMGAYDPRADLAPRDIVARAVHAELKRCGQPHVWLDATGLGAERLESRFPRILEGCRAVGIDPTTQAIPVVPAAHYMCGGVWTDAEGRATLSGLFAAGECACTGVHGANRLASNSLLEAVVFAERAAQRMLEELAGAPTQDSIDTAPPAELSGFPLSQLQDLRARLKQLMWDHLGIVRTRSEMLVGADMLRQLRHQWTQAREQQSGTGDGLRWAEAAELLNMIDVAELIVRSALWRRESRGLHFVVDYPHKDNEAYLRDSLITSKTAGSTIHSGANG
jgi:L-aspartate oxidase